MRRTIGAVFTFLFLQACGNAQLDGYALVNFQASPPRALEPWSNGVKPGEWGFGDVSPFTNPTACPIEAMRIEITGPGIPGGVNILPIPNPPVIQPLQIDATGGAFPAFSFLVPLGNPRVVRVSGIFDNQCMNAGTAGNKNVFMGIAKKFGNAELNVQSDMTVDLEVTTSQSYPVKAQLGGTSPFNGTNTDLRAANLGIAEACSASSGQIQDFRHNLTYSFPIPSGSGSIMIYPLVPHARYRVTYNCGTARDFEFRMGPGAVANATQTFTCTGTTCTCSVPATGCLPL